MSDESTMDKNNAMAAIEAMEIIKPLLAMIDPGQAANPTKRQEFFDRMGELTDEQMAKVKVLGNICMGIETYALVRKLRMQMTEHNSRTNFS